MLDLAHENFGHPCIKKMLNIISSVYYYPTTTQDITKCVKIFYICQKKTKQKIFGLLQVMPATDRLFE